jgi:DNA polymerase III psi subunit
MTAHPFINEELYQIKTENLVVIRKAYFDLSESEKSLLSNILISINEFISYTSLNSTFTDTSIDELAANYSAKRFIIFNEKNTVVEEKHHSGASIVYAAHLQELARNEALKKQLWQSLKKLFAQ